MQEIEQSDNNKYCFLIMSLNSFVDIFNIDELNYLKEKIKTN